MHTTVLCLAVAALGIDVGWQPLADGGMEYIIQIEPHMLETLKGGLDIASDIPPNLRGVRSYRITVGTGQLPREILPQPEVDPPDFPALSVPRTLPADNGSKPLDGQPANYIEQGVAGEHPGASPPGDQTSPDDDPPKPWMPLTLAVAGMFGSTGGMLYLGWIAWDYRRRYRGLLERLIEAGGGRMQLVEPPDARAG